MLPLLSRVFAEHPPASELSEAGGSLAGCFCIPALLKSSLLPDAAHSKNPNKPHTFQAQFFTPLWC